MKGMDRLTRGGLALFFALTMALIYKTDAKAETITDVEKGIKATLKVDASKSMVDLFLNEEASGKPILEAKVKAKVTTPEGKKVEKDLVGMKMGGVFSYMNMLDMSGKGRYIFDIKVEADKKSALFNFSLEIN